MDMMPRAASPESTPTAPHPHRPRIGFSIDFLVGKSAAKAVDADPADSDGADEETPVKKMEERRADSGAIKGNKSPGSSAEHSPPSSPASSRSNSPDGVRSASNPLLTFPSWNPAAGGGNFGAGGAPPGPYLDMAALASVRALYAQQPDAGRTPFYPSAAPGSLFNLHGTSAAVAAAAAAAAAGAAGPASGPALPGAFGRPSEALAQQWWLLAQARQQQQRLLAAAAASQRFPPGPELAGFLLSPFRKPKRVRTAFSPSQLLKLEHAFEKNHYVVGAERKQLAQALNLTETQVKVWFQNRRTKHKRVQQEDEPEPGKGSGSGGSSQSKSSGNNNNNNSGASSSTSAQESRQRHHDDEDDSEMSDIDLEDSDDQMDLSASSHHLHHPHLHHHHRSDSN